MERERTIGRALIPALLLSAPGMILAQQSASYRLHEQVLNAGGRPADSIAASSPGFRLGLESIGEAMADSTASSASFRLEAGLVPAYPPPGEVAGLRLLDEQTLSWSWEPASTAYNVYSGPLATLPGAYGGCAVSRVAANGWPDPSAPPPGGAVFYLVTGENRLREEGTKGWTSAGVERGNPAPCP